MIQDSEDGPSCTPMTSSSKQNNELGVKESNKSNLKALDPKTEALHAFRTITTMLSLIQSARGTAGNRPKFSSQEKRQLQLLDALAAVLVRNNGVIAVTARSYDSDDSGKVEVLATYLGNGESLTISQSLFTGQFINIIRNVFISQNPRDLSIKQRDVVDPKTSVPDYLKETSDPTKLLNNFLTYTW
jgi:hypothetical protein